MAEATASPIALFFSLLLGVLPPIIWLIFWLREDEKHPEPRYLILLTFLGGMICVAPAYFLQKMVINLLPVTALLYFVWPLIEEIAKFSTAYFFALRTREFNEPIDALIYLVSAALGFAASENFLFLIDKHFSIISFLTANMRFIGATLLHLLSSGTIGVFLAVSFFRNKMTRIWAGFWGLITATILHSLFNYFIIKSEGDSMLGVFVALWSLIIILIFFFEGIKGLKK